QTGRHRMRRGRVALALVLGLIQPVAGGALEPTPAVRDAWTTVRTFHEDLTRIDRARDLLEAEVARAPTVEAMLLLSWAHFAWADHRAGTREAKLASYERG